MIGPLLDPRLSKAPVDDVLTVVHDVYSRTETISTAVRALAVYVGLRAGVPPSRMSNTLGVNPQRISQLRIYGALVAQRHREGFALEEMHSERSLRRYFIDARKETNSVESAADLAYRRATGSVVLTLKGSTGEVQETLPMHPEDQKELHFHRVRTAVSSIRNVAKRVSTTVDHYGSWEAWARDTPDEEVQNFRRTANWLRDKLGDAMEELA